MGYELVEEVLDHAPTMSPAEGLVLIAIAEETRWPGEVRDISSSTMTRRTRGLSQSGIRKALSRLAARGVEVRVPLGQGEDGRPYYSVPGRSPAYRLPRFPAPEGCECVRCQEPKGGAQSRLEENPQVTEGGTPVPPSEQGGTTVHEGGTTGRPGGTRGTPGGTTVPPTPSHPGDPSLSGPERKVMSAVDATVDETREIIRLIKRENQPRSLAAYVARMADNGDLDDLLARVRAEAAQRTARPSTPLAPEPDPGEASQTTPEERDAAIAAAKALLRGMQGPRSRRRSAAGPVRVVRPREDVDASPEVAAARAELNRRGDAFDLMTLAQARLGDNADRDDVIVLAAKLARGGTPAMAPT